MIILPKKIIINLAVYTMLLVCLLVLRHKKGYVFSVVAKFITSLGFISLALNCCSYSDWNGLCKTMIITGLVFGCIGDVLLEIKYFYPRIEGIMLNLGFLSFGIGHVFYIMAIIKNATVLGISYIWIYITVSVILSAIGAAVNNKVNQIMKMNVEVFKRQTSAYFIAMATVTLISIGLSFASPFFIFGAIAFILFLLSDLVLSFIYFGGKRDSKIFNSLNLILYYTAQSMIAMYILLDVA